MITIRPIQERNQHLLDQLFTTGRIRVQRSALFDAQPVPLPPAPAWERIEGMLFGLAIGDALGNTSESQNPDRRRAQYGEIRDYQPNRYADGRAVGLPSDDTQLAFWTLEQMLADDGIHPEHIAARFCREQIFGIGSAVKGFIANYKAGYPWYACGSHSAGNGALMRIAPAVIPYLRQPSPDLWVDTALLAMITHNDPASISACLAFTGMLWELLGMASLPEPQWWAETYVALAREVEGATQYRSRSPAYQDYTGPLWRFVAEEVPAAYHRGLPLLDAANRWYSGAYLLETVPTVLYLLMQHGGDPEEALIRAVNDTRDNDTVAAIVGAAVGALHGITAFPERWRAGLLGRTEADDDGRVYALLEAARSRWWEAL